MSPDISLDIKLSRIIKQQNQSTIPHFIVSYIINYSPSSLWVHIFSSLFSNWHFHFDFHSSASKIYFVSKSKQFFNVIQFDDEKKIENKKTKKKCYYQWEENKNILSATWFVFPSFLSCMAQHCFKMLYFLFTYINLILYVIFFTWH